MHITRQVLEPIEAKYGQPAELQLTWPISESEMTMLRSSKRGWREHDVTLFIFGRDGRLALIRKPFFPAGAFRAPSGGIDPGEPFEAGALREALEETGLQVSLQQYLLRIKVQFTYQETVEPWVSHIFTAKAEGEELNPHDTDEIAEVRWAAVQELQGPIRSRMLAAGAPLLAYRVYLTDAVVERLKEA